MIEFFRKHHAVPATDAGVQWHMAAEDALIGWCASQCQAWDDQPGAHPALLPNLKELRRETWWRLKLAGEDSPAYRRLVNAWHTICTRIGFGGDE